MNSNNEFSILPDFPPCRHNPVKMNLFTMDHFKIIKSIKLKLIIIDPASNCTCIIFNVAYWIILPGSATVTDESTHSIGHENFKWISFKVVWWICAFYIAMRVWPGIFKNTTSGQGILNTFWRQNLFQLSNQAMKDLIILLYNARF